MNEWPHGIGTEQKKELRNFIDARISRFDEFDDLM